MPFELPNSLAGLTQAQVVELIHSWLVERTPEAERSRITKTATEVHLFNRLTITPVTIGTTGGRTPTEAYPEGNFRGVRIALNDMTSWRMVEMHVRELLPDLVPVELPKTPWLTKTENKFIQINGRVEDQVGILLEWARKYDAIFNAENTQRLTGLQQEYERRRIEIQAEKRRKAEEERIRKEEEEKRRKEEALRKAREEEEQYLRNLAEGSVSVKKKASRVKSFHSVLQNIAKNDKLKLEVDNALNMALIQLGNNITVRLDASEDGIEVSSVMIPKTLSNLEEVNALLKKIEAI